MLIGTSPRYPNLERARRIKKALREALSLSDDMTVTVTELACLEEGCAPVETVIGLMRHSFSASYTNPWTPLTPGIWSGSARRGDSTSKFQYSYLCSRRTR